MLKQTIFAVTAIACLGVSQSVVAQKPQPAQKKLILESYQVYRNGKSVCVEGKVKNVSGKPQKFIQTTVDYYAADGQYIDSHIGGLESEILMNNQSESFFIDSDVNPATSKVRLRFIDGFNGKTELSYSARNARTPLVASIVNAPPRICGTAIMLGAPTP